MSPEAAPPQLLDERTLVTARLADLEHELAAGSYDHPPVQFRAATELEVGITTEPEWERAIQDSSYDGALHAAKVFIPDRSITPLSPEARAAKLEEVKTDARHTISALQPQNIDEQLRQKEWLGQIDSFSYPEAINYLVYKEFSQPALGDTAVPTDASLEQIDAYSAERGWVEFRFGTGELQSGYYDNPGTSELRLTPCSPSEQARREQIITDRMVQLATEFGAVVGLGGRHLNISAYREDSKGEWQSVLGTAEESAATTLAALAGITQAIEDGAFLHEASTTKSINFQNMSPDRYHIASRARVSMRVKHNYLELREQSFMSDPAHGLLLLMAGTAEGLEKGWGALAQEIHGIPVPRDEIVPRPSAGFVKEIHLPILRALENSNLNEQGGFTTELHFWDAEEVPKVAQALLGEGLTKDMDLMQALGLNGVILGALRTDKENRLYCTAESLLASMQHMEHDELMGSVVPLVRHFIVEGGDSVAALVNMKVGTIKIEGQQRFIRGNPRYEGLDPVQTRHRLEKSDVFNRMYGKQSGAYAANLAVRAAAYIDQTRANANAQTS
jgi:hypothetical protein